MQPQRLWAHYLCYPLPLLSFSGQATVLHSILLTRVETKTSKQWLSHRQMILTHTGRDFPLLFIGPRGMPDQAITCEPALPRPRLCRAKLDRSIRGSMLSQSPNRLEVGVLCDISATRRDPTDRLPQ